MKDQSCEGGITRAVEQSLYAQMHKVFVGARSEWLNAFDQLEAQNPAPIRAFASGGVR